MRTVLITLLVLGFAVPASGEIVLFWSTTGISNPSFVYSTALTNFLPYMVPPTPVVDVLVPGTYDLFLWGRFIENNDPNSPNYLPTFSQIYGIDLQFLGNAAVSESAGYRHFKTGSGTYKRWDGTVGVPLDGIMAAVTARGIEFLIPPAWNNDLYYPATQEFLLGAARVSGDPGEHLVMALQDQNSSPPGLGIAVRWIGGIPDPAVIPASVTFFPEPAGVLPLLIVALLRRR